MATSADTQVTCINGISGDNENKPITKLLKKINRHTDEKQFEKVKFLAKGLQLRGVSRADSVLLLHRALDNGCATQGTAIALLQHLLDKAGVDRDCRSQLDAYATGTQDIAPLKPNLHFREMLLDVSEELGNDAYFHQFRDIVAVKLDANINNYKSPLAVFQRLIDVGALKVCEESVNQLEQWLVDSGRHNIAQGTVQSYRENFLQHSKPEVISKSYDASETDNLLGPRAAGYPSVQNGPKWKEAPQKRGRTCCIIKVLPTCTCVVMVVSFTIVLALYGGGELLDVPSDQSLKLYNNKPVLAYGTRIDAFRSRKAYLMVTKGTLYEVDVITACALTQTSNKEHIKSRAVNYSKNLTSEDVDVRWIAKLGNAPNPIDEFDYIVRGTLNYSLEITGNIGWMEQVDISFFSTLDTCHKFHDEARGNPDMNGVSCTRSNTTSVVTYTCDFNKPAYRCAVWTVPTYSNFTYSTYGWIDVYRIGGSSDNDNKTCHSFGSNTGSKQTISLNPSFTWTTEWQYLLVTLSNAELYDDATVMVHLDTRVSSIAFVCGCVILLIAVIVLLILCCLLLRYYGLCRKRRNSPFVRMVIPI